MEKRTAPKETEMAERYPFLKPCPWHATSDAECSMMREREVAGTDRSIPWCDHHGEYIGDEG
jgi:hypothetical protein